MPGPDDDPLEDVCTCGHTRGAHHTIDEACLEDGCECVAFEQVNPFGNEKVGGLEEFLRRGQAAQDAVDDIIEEHRRQVSTATRNNTREAVDRPESRAFFRTTWCAGCGHDCADHEDGEGPCQLEGCDCIALIEYTGGSLGISHEERAHELDREPGSPVEGMYPDQREDSDAVQRAQLDRLCTCGHRYRAHGQASDVCLVLSCDCEEFTDATVALVEEARDTPDPLRWHGYPDHEPPEFGGDLEPGDRIVPPLLRQARVSGYDLQRILGRDKAEEILRELDPVTNNYGLGQHWQTIERIAGDVSPEPATGDPRRPHNENSEKAIAQCLLDLRRLVESVPSQSYLEQLAKVISGNADAIKLVGDAVEAWTDKLRDPK